MKAWVEGFAFHPGFLLKKYLTLPLLQPYCRTSYSMEG